MSGPEWTFAWTPPDGDFLGAVGLRRVPSGEFTLAAYRFALAEKIDRMIALETSARAVKLLRIAYDREGLDVGDRLGVAGLLLAENSDCLREHCLFGFEPRVLGLADHEPASLKRLVERPMRLNAFLKHLYSES